VCSSERAGAAHAAAAAVRGRLGVLIAARGHVSANEN